jgi:hypothetical protein
MNEDQARKAHAQELVKTIRRQAAAWMGADAMIAPYDGRDVITESTRLDLWRLGYGHLDPTGRGEAVHFKWPVQDGVPDPAMAARLGDLVRDHRAEAAAIEGADPVGATILRAKADVISECLVEAGYDESGRLPGRL